MLKTDILSINPEIVCNIILKTKEFHAKEASTFYDNIPDSEYEYDWSQILTDRDDDLTYLEIQKVIDDLEPDQQVDLLALMYIGREDFDSNDWSGAHKEAKNNLTPHLTRYLLSKPLIANYLEKGLEAFGYICDE